MAFADPPSASSPPSPVRLLRRRRGQQPYLALLPRRSPSPASLEGPADHPFPTAFLSGWPRYARSGDNGAGLKDTKNYTTLVWRWRGTGSPRWYRALRRTLLDRYLWKYPVVRKLPYKGFFESDGASARRPDSRRRL
jgi:hypothetical protein